MTIKIKHNIKREGCTLSGQILDCNFISGFRGNIKTIIINGFYLKSFIYPELRLKDFYIWGYKDEHDMQMISYTYPSEKDAQDMLDFINRFT